MLISEAKNLLRMSGYRLIKETVDVFEDVAEVLESYGYEKDEVKDMLDTFATDVEDGYEKGMTASEIADMVSGLQKDIDESYIYEGKSKGKSDKLAHREKAAYKNKKKSYEEEDDSDDDDDDLDEAFLEEGKSKPKGDKFAHKEKVAGRKPKGGCCGKKGCKDCEDDDLDESIAPDNGWAESHKKYGSISDFYEVLVDRGYSLEGAKDWVDRNMGKIVMLKRKGYTIEDIVFELDGPLAESIEDVPGLTREPRGQVGTDDWSDFKDDFRAKTLLLKKALTPKFVSELIKRTNFEVDEKDIKSYAFDVIENANLDAQNPVDALQRKLRRHFTGI